MLRTSTLRLLLCLLAIPFSVLHAQPAHNQSFFPPTCARLEATHTASFGALTSEQAPDTARIQQALDACPIGQSVELTPNPNTHADAFLLAPIRLPGGVTLLIDAGVTAFASRNPADYLSSPTVAPTALITIASSTGNIPAGLMGFGILDGRGNVPLLHRPQSWYDLNLPQTPTLVDAHGPLALHQITLRNAPADAVHISGDALLDIDSITIVSPSTAPGTRGIVLTGSPAPFTLTRSSISVAGPALSGAVPTGPLKLYAGAGLEPALPRHNHCLATPEPTLACSPANLPSAAAALFLSSSTATNLQAAIPGDTPLTLNAVLIAAESTLPTPQSPVTFFDGATLLGTALPTNTLATLPLPTLTFGLHLLTALYEGVPFGSVEVTVPAATTSKNITNAPLALTADATTLPVRAALHLIASPNPNPTATGTVTFLEGATPLATLPIDPATGLAIFTTTTLTSGPHTLIATYSGDSLNPSATSLPILVTITPRPAPFTLSTDLASVFTGQPLTLTAHGLPPDATGTLAFLDHGVPFATTTITPTQAPAFFAFGDDIPAGASLSSKSLAYPSLLAAQFGLSLTNSAATQYAACDILGLQLLNSLATQNQPTTPLTSLQVNVNDTFPYESEQSFLLCHQAASAFLAIPRAFKVLAGDPAATILSGAWQQHPTSGVDPGVLANTTGTGSLQFALTTTGAPIYLWYMLDSARDGLFTTTLDGTPSATSTNVRSLLGTNNATGTGFAMLRLPVSAGHHIFTIDVVSGSVGILGIGTVPPVAANIPHPIVLVADIPYENTAAPRDDPAFTAPFNADMQAGLAPLIADGLDLRLVPTRQFLLGTSDEMSDGILPNPLGHQHLANAFASLLANLPASSFSAYLPTLPSAVGELENDGVRTLTALYSGDTNYAPATSTSTNVSVQNGFTLLNLTAPTQVPYNTPFTLTATIAPATATGTITFTQGAQILGTADLVNSVATLTVTLPTGAWPLTATFASDEFRQASTSPTVYTTVGRRPAAIALAAAAQGMPSASPATTLTATLTSASATGTVTFTDETLLTLGQAPVVEGVAVLAVSGGPHTYRAAYSGDPVYLPLTSPAVAFTPTRLTPSLLAFPAASQVVFGTPTSIHVDALAVASPLFPVAPATFSAALNQTTVFIGDSITQYWPMPLNGRGIAGQTTAEMLARFPADVLNHGFERVLLLGGTNDIIKLGAPPSVTVANLESMASLATAAGMRVVLCTLPPLTAFGTDLNQQVLAVNAAILAFAAQNSFPVVDYHAALIQHPDDFLDGIHPTPAGYAYMETALAQSLIPLTGTVSLPDGTAAKLSVTGTATLTSATLSPGTPANPITVTFAGDANMLPAAAAVSLTVTPAASAIALHAQPLAGYSGNSVALTGTISTPTAVPPTGTVLFFDGPNRVGAATLTPGAPTPAFTATNLGNGPHTFTAAYLGDANFIPATSPPITLTTPYSDTSLTLSAPSPTFTATTAIPLTANLLPTTATGTVSFLDGANILAQVPLSNGLATFTIPSLSVGPHALTALYSGDPNNTITTSPVLALNITQTPATLTLAPLPASQLVGASTLLAATITPTSATGLVTFTDTFTTAAQPIPTTLALGTARLAAGAAAFTPPILPVGTHTFAVTYPGDTATLAAASNPLTVTINPIPATLTITTPQTSLPFGAAATVNIAISPATAAGLITLRDATADTQLQATLANGLATFTLPGLSTGFHTLVASYSGDTNTTAATSPSLTLTLTPDPTTLTLAPLPATVDAGSPLTLTATISPTAATGLVTFRDATLGTLGQATLTNGIATLTLTAAPVLTYTISATYPGDLNDVPSTSATLTTQVTLLPTTTTLAAPQTSPYASPVTLTANVTPSPTSGVLTFFDNATPLGQALLTAGTATFTLPTLTPGTHALHATFPGNPDLAASTSKPTSLTITQNPSTTTLTPVQLSVPAGAPLAFNLNVTGATTTALPTGTVTLHFGFIALGTATLTQGAGPSAYATLTADSTLLGPGTFPITATYSGDAGTLTSSAATTIAITRLPTIATLTLAATTLPLQTPTLLTVTLTGPTPAQVPTGTVTFLLNNNPFTTLPLDSTGTATATLPGQPAGTYTLTATYNPASPYAASATLPQTLTVTAPLSIAFADSAIGMTPGSSGSTTLTLTPLSGFSGAIASTCTTSVPFLHCTLQSPTILTAPTTVTLHLAADTSTETKTAQNTTSQPTRIPKPPTCALLLTLLIPLATRRRLRKLPLLLIVLLTLALTTVTGCADGGNFGDLPSGAQFVTVTVTANGTPIHAQLTINISQ